MMKTLLTHLSALILATGLTASHASEALHKVKASSFADPADVAAYKRCIGKGRTPKECFAFGDNGIGLWGDDTTDVNKPMCALPRDDWEAKWGRGNRARGRKIIVSYKSLTVTCELRDTMPAKARITNGAGIDLSPGAAKAFGKRPPFMLDGVKWRWADSP